MDYISNHRTIYIYGKTNIGKTTSVLKYLKTNNYEYQYCSIQNIKNETEFLDLLKNQNIFNMMSMNKNERVFCAIRPPGHHAETIKSIGFCFINNIAVTARYLQKKYKINKIAIIDFDVHHGNGTQEIFYKDDTVAYGSSHEFPLFPGTGLEQETGVGNIFNATLKSGTKSKEFLKIFEQKVLNPINKFKPEIILISAGFDAHFRDPLANINLESRDFYEITRKIVDVANIHCEGRIISFLEGGYDLIALSESVKEHLSALKA